MHYPDLKKVVLIRGLGWNNWPWHCLKLRAQSCYQNDLLRSKTCCSKDYLFNNSTVLSSQNAYTTRTNTSFGVASKNCCIGMKFLLRLCIGKKYSLHLNTGIVDIFYLLHLHFNIIIWLWKVLCVAGWVSF